jgi:hypothetical protein
MRGERDACAWVQPELEPWLRGDLDESAADAIEAHVARCPSCTGEVAWLRPLVKDLEGWGAATYADGVADRVLARAAGEEPVGPSGPSAPTLGGQLVLAVVTIAVVGLALLLRDTGPPPAPATPSPPPRAVSVEGPPTSPAPPPAPVVEDRVEPEVAPPVPPTPPDEPPAPPPDVAPPAEADPLVVVVEAPPPVVPAPPPPTATETGPVVEAPPTVAPAARDLATLLHGEARVRRGGRAWSALREGELLRAGDALDAEGPVVLALAGAQDDRSADGSFDTRDRVVLAPGARTTIAPAGESGHALQVDAGAVLVATSGAVAVRAGACVVHVTAGDAEVGLRSGAVTVVARAGQVELQVGVRDERQVLAVGQRAAIDRRGRVGAAAAARDPALPWTAALSGATGRAVAAYPARPGSAALALLVGTPAGASGVSGVTRPATGPNTQVVCWGEADPARAIAPLRAGATLSFEYRLSASVPLGVQVTDVTQERNFQGVLATPRVGAWTWTHVRLERLEDEAKQGARPALGDLLDFVTISAHGDAPGVVLEVREARLE